MIENVWKEHGLTQDEYKQITELMGKEPNHLELALFGVMWSEHCSCSSSRGVSRGCRVGGTPVEEGPGESAGVI